MNYSPYNAMYLLITVLRTAGIYYSYSPSNVRCLVILLSFQRQVGPCLLITLLTTPGIY